MLKFLKRKPDSMLGIDIGPTSVTLLELSKTQGLYRVENYERGFIHDSRSLISNASFSPKRIISSVPDSSTITKIIQVSAAVNEQDLEELVCMEAEKFIPFPLEEVNLDFKITGLAANNSELLDVFIVASRAEDVELRVEALRRAGLIANIIDVESLAIERAFQLLPNHSRNSALFNIGHSFMHCMVFHEKKIIFSREERLPEQPTIEAILVQIKRALQYCSSALPLFCIEQLMLSGEISLFPGLRSIVQEQLSIPTDIASPFSHMDFSTAMIREKIENDEPLLMVACGLALRGFSL